MYLTKNGVKTHEFAYSTYGELTKGEYGEVRFMYNGRLGVVTDSNGLYYMRARYYNPEIRRFINQDIITGSIENSQSLNRYAYCQGNPVNYLDPFGLSPQSFGSWAGHTVLNLLSFVPVFGNAADAFNAIWYAYEGNYAEAIACAVGAIPLIGNLATGFKIGSKVVKGCNIVANGGKAAIGFYNGVQNVMNIDRMIRTGTGRWYDYVGQGVQFGLNMFVSAVGVSGAWNGISNLVDELNYSKMQKLAQEVSWDDIDGGPELDKLIITKRKFSSNLNPSALKYNGDGTWTSNEGLVYGQGSKDGNRVKHVLQHTQPKTNKPLHTVFNVDKTDVIGLIDEAWVKKGREYYNQMVMFVMILTWER